MLCSRWIFWVLLFFTNITIASDATWVLSKGQEVDSFPHYKGMSYSSYYLTMRDDVKIAVDLYLPKGLPKEERIPANRETGSTLET